MPWEKSDDSWGAAAAGSSWEEDKKAAKKDDWSAGGWGNDKQEAAPAADAWKGKADDTWTKGDDPWAAAAGHDKKEEKQEDAWATGDSGQDAWGTGQTKDTWGDTQQQQENKPPPAHDFWDTQKSNKDYGVCPRKEEWQLEQDDTGLFHQDGRAQQGLSFSKYENVPVDISGNKAQFIPVCKTFDEIYEKFSTDIPEALMANMRKIRYTTPTPVQKFAMPCGLVGRDVMCCAQTGSGKTAAFLIPIVGRMMNHHTNPVGALQVPFEGLCLPDTLVLTPTRELCIQIFEEAQKFCHRTNYRVALVYGGAKPKDQLIEIAKGADLMVATPGRLQDFINRGVVGVSAVHVLVLDEADRMLDMGFETQVREIVESHGMKPKEERQTMMFSATFPESCQKMAADYLYDYIWIAVGVIGGAVETVHQTFKKVTPASKFEDLILELDDFFQKRQDKGRMLIFVNAKDTAKWLDEQLYEKKFDTGALHGNLEQAERETNLGRFRKGEIDIMVATDVAARGLDIENVAVVVNYDVPRDSETYIHRIGRTGRIGNDGKAVTFLSCDDSGSCLEGAELLRSLSDVLKNSSAEIPEWLQPLIETTEGGGSKDGWGWNAKDSREGQEANTWSGTGDAWGKWDADKGGEKDASSSWGGNDSKEKEASSGWGGNDSKSKW